MRNYSETERLAHVEEWKKGTLSKAAYAKSVGIIPTTFYTWIQNAHTMKENFVELPQVHVPEDTHSIVIEKGAIIIRVPLSIGITELQTIFGALGKVS